MKNPPPTDSLSVWTILWVSLYLLEMDFNTFLQTFRFTPEQFRQSGLNWDELTAISEDYKRQLPDLETIAR